jgi:hypothetical protein
MSALTLPELEQAANGVINILKSVPEFFNARIAVIGGMGVMKYTQSYRATNVCKSKVCVVGNRHPN